MALRFGMVLVLATAAFAEEWKPLLADADPQQRLRAAAALAKNGAADAVPELTECLIDSAAELRGAAAHALGRAGPAASAALPELKRLFRDPSRRVRMQAYAAVARIGDMDAIAEAVRRDRNVLGSFGADELDVLRALLRDKSWHVRLWVLQHKLVRAKAPVAWVDSLARLALDDPAQVVRLHAVGALAYMKQPKAVAPLVKMLADKDARIRAAAVVGLVLQRSDDETVVRAIEARLADEVPQVRAWACFALRRRKASIAAIQPLLDAPEPELRLVAAAVLGELGVWPSKSADLLVAGAHGFKAPYPIVHGRRNLRAGGGVSGFSAHEVYPIVSGIAHDVVLASGGKAVPHLERAFKTEQDAWRRQELVFALGYLSAADSLVPALTDAKLPVNRAAAACRAWLGEKDAETIQLLVQCIDGKQSELYTGVDWAATAAGLLEKIGEPALPALQKRLDKVPGVKRVDLGNGAWSETREEADEIEEQRLKELIRRIRAK